MDHFTVGLTTGILAVAPLAILGFAAWGRALARLREAREELAEAGDYAYRLLEEPEFYREELGTAVEVADHNVRGVFGRIPNGPPLAVPSGSESWLP